VWIEIEILFSGEVGIYILVGPKVPPASKDAEAKLPEAGRIVLRHFLIFYAALIIFGLTLFQ
jgi:hypothetical protein